MIGRHSTACVPTGVTLHALSSSGTTVRSGAAMCKSSKLTSHRKYSITPHAVGNASIDLAVDPSLAISPDDSSSTSSNRVLTRLRRLAVMLVRSYRDCLVVPVRHAAGLPFGRYHHLLARLQMMLLLRRIPDHGLSFSADPFPADSIERPI